MQKIKNIIFDLGGVFIGIDYFKTERAFIDLGVSNFNELYNQHQASDLFKNLETGKLSPTEFYSDFRQITNVQLTDNQIETAWNAMLGDFYKKHLDWLKTIKEKYWIFLFSNTNIIHYNAFQKIYQQQTGSDDFDQHFIHAYYSHDLGLRKPDPASFEAILAKENLVADETLFIDDTKKNIEGANKVGLHTIYLQNPEVLIDLVNEYGKV